MANIFRPSTTAASIKLLREYATAANLGTEVIVARKNLCCGQPSYTNGDFSGAKKVVEYNIRKLWGAPSQTQGILGEDDKLIVPSGSCSGMIKFHYQNICGNNYKEAARQIAFRTFELSEFLDLSPIHGKDQNAVKHNQSDAYSGQVSPIVFHSNCAALREMNIIKNAVSSIEKYTGKKPSKLSNNDECCGFGGTFCVKYPHIAQRMADNKLEAVANSLSENLDKKLPTAKAIVTSTDLGCLLHLARNSTNKNLMFYHISEVLSGEWHRLAPIGTLTGAFIGPLRLIWHKIKSYFKLN